jgi:hypothetical protein
MIVHSKSRGTRRMITKKNGDDPAEPVSEGEKPASLGLNDYCQINTLRARYKFVNLRAKTSPSL